MKPAAIFVNTARGEVMEEEAVARAIEERWIAAAAIDAFVKEPLPRSSRSWRWAAASRPPTS